MSFVDLDCMPLTPLSSFEEARYLGHIRLWLDDLDSMVKIVREAVSDKVVIVVDGHFNADEVEDIARQYESPRLKSFLVRARESGVTLELSKNVAVLRLGKPDLTIRGMATEIERLTRARRRSIYPYRLIFVALGFASFGFGLSLLAGSALGDPSVPLSVLLGLFGGILSVLLFGGFPQLRGGSSAIIIAKAKEDAPPWLQRNKDALVTNAIVSAVFLVVGVAIGYLIPKP
jgi:hypothetical protein